MSSNDVVNIIGERTFFLVSIESALCFNTTLDLYGKRQAETIANKVYADEQKYSYSGNFFTLLEAFIKRMLFLGE